jgi:hypothetical protein
MRAKKLVLTQKEVELKELRPKQDIAFIYTSVKAGPILLSAVVNPVGGK